MVRLRLRRSDILLRMLLRSPDQRNSRVEDGRCRLAVDLSIVRCIGQHLGKLSIKGVFLFLVVFFLLGILDKDHVVVIIVIVIDSGFVYVLLILSQRGCSI